MDLNVTTAPKNGYRLTQFWGLLRLKSTLFPSFCHVIFLLFDLAAPAYAATEQPGQATKWMPAGPTIPGYPPGLEYLAYLDEVVVEQNVDFMEVTLAWEGSNGYRVLNKIGEQCYFAFERSDVVSRQFLGKTRGFTLEITNSFEQPVFTIERPFKLCGDCAWCAFMECGQNEVTIRAVDGRSMGHVKQRWSLWRAHFLVTDHKGFPHFEIWGPVLAYTLLQTQVEYTIISIQTGKIIGVISKKWSGFAEEMFTDSDTFGITFPLDLDVRMKAVLVGCLFLIDFMYYEDGASSSGMVPYK